MSGAHIELAMIAARGRNGVIGNKGELPWRLKSDFAWFKAQTLGKPVIMGRKTWESLPRRPLPGRPNLVVSRDDAYIAEGAETCASLPIALERARALAVQSGASEVMLIGGAALYEAALPLADRLYLTEVEAAPEGDAWFPALDEAQWREIYRETRPAGEGDDHAMVLRILERRG